MENHHLQWRFPNLKYMQMNWRPGSTPHSTGGVFNVLPDPPAGFTGREGKGGLGMEGQGKGREKLEGEGEGR